MRVVPGSQVGCTSKLIVSNKTSPLLSTHAKNSSVPTAVDAVDPDDADDADDAAGETLRAAPRANTVVTALSFLNLDGFVCVDIRNIYNEMPAVSVSWLTLRA